MALLNNNVPGWLVYHDLAGYECNIILARVCKKKDNFSGLGYQNG